MRVVKQVLDFFICLIFGGFTTSFDYSLVPLRHGINQPVNGLWWKITPNTLQN